MRHKGWDRVFRMVDKIAEKFGGLVCDSRCHKTWDPGQALSALPRQGLARQGSHALPRVGG